MYEYDGIELPRGWAAKIERGATYDSLRWEQMADEEWEAKPTWQKVTVCVFAALLPFIASIVEII